MNALAGINASMVGIQTGVQHMPWHRQGLYMGMHWAWWLFWIAALALLGWAFWRLGADSRDTRLDARARLDAEDELRGRYARGEIEEEEFLKRMRVLRETRPT